MGNTESVVVQKRLARFRPEDRPSVEGIFDRLHAAADGHSGSQSKTPAGKSLTLQHLQSSMGNLASDSLVRRIFRCMCSIDPGPAAPAACGKSGAPAASGVAREQLVIFLADTLRGTAEERAPLILAMSQTGTETANVVKCEQVAEFLQDLISAVIQILVRKGHVQGWKPERMGDGSQGEKLLAEQMCSELKPSDEGDCDVSCLEDWIFRVAQVSLYLEMLVTEVLNFSLSSRPAPILLPPCKEMPWKELTCLVDLPTLMFLAPQLPDSYSAPWRLLFSTRLHGESFTRMVAGLMKGGPTLLLIKDTRGHVFGGFASHAWEVKPQFQGDSRCFLFTVFPRLRVYTATGYNEHFMYLNQNQQTMPNGLGPQRTNCLHLTLSSASSYLTPTTFKSSLTTSINLLFGLLLGLLPGSSKLSILLPIYSLSPLWTCPNHLSLASLTLSPKPLTCAVPLMYSFLILSFLVTPRENLSIFISATSSSVSCLFLSDTVSGPNNIAGLTTVLYTFPLISAETLLSHITLDTFLHPFHPACTRFFTSFPHSPLLWTVEPKYLKSSTFLISSPCNLTLPLGSLSFTHMYSVLLLLTFIPLLSRTNLHLSSFSSICSLLPLQITMSSANIIVHGDSCLTSSVRLSITIASKKGLRADP
ncbi:MTOR-associated protein MEAK7 isoform X1 [Antennarius striatus]|uniref:MTOR-associated protein MEAK7 isoform X1 n=1 Tax=Antennarius striatus TaxID=241820 RepID=UPI0035B1CA40